MYVTGACAGFVKGGEVVCFSCFNILGYLLNK